MRQVCRGGIDMIDTRPGEDGILYVYEFVKKPFHYKRIAEVQWLPESMVKR